MRALRHLFLTATALSVVGCPKTTSTEPPVAPAARTVPPPLPERPFKMPSVERRTLSNGLEVVVATNTEVPLFDMRLALKTGGWLDPEGQDGLASVTFDLLNDGAGDMTAEDISRELKRLGSSVGAGAGTTGASVTASGLKKNLEPTLDIWAKVLTAPTFPDEEWTIVKKRRIADVKAGREDPNGVARAVSYRVLYGDRYEGRKPIESDYEAIDTAAMKAFYARYVGPANAMLIVGGDVTADEIVPLLEARIGSWKPEVEPVTPALEVAAPASATLYFVDKPGAAQSVIRLATVVGSRTEPGFYPFYMANEAIGGQFTSRVNLNLREEKGYTYGARCFVASWDGPGIWGCSASVQTAVTKEALLEFQKEIEGARGDRPVTADELAYFQSNEVHGFPGQYETVSTLLDQQVDIWRYGLPATWLEDHVPAVSGVTVDEANTAFRTQVDPTRIAWVVVGDKATVFEGLSALGLPILELDRDGNPLHTP